MGDLGHDLQFGIFLTPDAAQAEAIVELARLADGLQLELLGVQDHPYQPRFLDAWTLLATLAGQTERIRLVPDVLTLPLRQPAVLACAAASPRSSVGAGWSWGWASARSPTASRRQRPRRSPKEAVDALEEAIAVIRGARPPGQAATFDGKYYQLQGAQPGLATPHPIGIWLGSYKPRLLRLTGRLADGWPSSPYAAPDELGEMNRIISEAAVEAGRDPAAIRRLYNVGGRFAAREGGFLQGPPRLWIEQLTALALEQGISGFLLMPTGDPADDLRRFAEEVAPGVREAVERARREGRAAPAGEGVVPAEAEAPAGPWVPSAAHTPRAGRVPHSEALNEAARPRLRKNPDAVVTLNGRRSQETLLGVHEHLRQELQQIREAAAAGAGGRLDPRRRASADE
ncbi:MAG: LLM class flavin-dependent oxidoreductase [Chloroflexia bacterium]